jgi:hypothetical protein
MFPFLWQKIPEQPQLRFLKGKIWCHKELFIVSNPLYKVCIVEIPKVNSTIWYSKHSIILFIWLEYINCTKGFHCDIYKYAHIVVVKNMELYFHTTLAIVLYFLVIVNDYNLRKNAPKFYLIIGFNT